MPRYIKVQVEGTEWKTCFQTKTKGDRYTECKKRKKHVSTSKQ
jgi:hypothetical protein